VTLGPDLLLDADTHDLVFVDGDLTMTVDLAQAVKIALLFVAGFVQSFCLTPLAAVMLRSAGEAMRGRVMGVRMLAIWGLPLGLLAAGPMIARFGYATTTFVYAGLGLAATLAIAWRWRDALWHRSAAANVA